MRTHISKISRSANGKNRFHDRPSRPVLQSFTGDDDNSFFLLQKTLHIPQIRLLLKGSLRQINEVRPGAASVSCQRSGCRNPSGVPAGGLHHGYVNRQALHVCTDLTHALRQKSCRTGIAWTVIRNCNIVVHRLGNAHDGNLISLFFACPVNLSAGIHRPVSAIHQEKTDPVLFQDLCDPPVFRLLQLVAGRADGAAGCLKKLVKLRLRHPGQIDQVFF